MSLTCCALGAGRVLATDVEADALQRVEGAPRPLGVRVGGAASGGGVQDAPPPELATRAFDVLGAEPLPTCDVLLASDVGYTEALAYGFARRAAEALARGNDVAPTLRICDGPSSWTRLAA